jgi:hypothetical protein
LRDLRLDDPPTRQPIPEKLTITLKRIAAELAKGHDLPKKIAEAVLDDLIASQKG